MSESGTDMKQSAGTAGTPGKHFWIAGKHFGLKFTLFCRIVKFVENYAIFNTVFKGKGFDSSMVQIIKA